MIADKQEIDEMLDVIKQLRYVQKELVTACKIVLNAHTVSKSGFGIVIRKALVAAGEKPEP